MFLMNFFNRSRSAEMAMLNHLNSEIVAMRVEREEMTKQLDELDCLIDSVAQKFEELAQSTQDLHQDLMLYSLRKSLRGGAPMEWQTFVDNIYVIHEAIDAGKIGREEVLRAGERSLNAYRARSEE